MWVQLECDTAEKHCFSSDEGDAWSLAYSNTDILYLEAVLRPEDQILLQQAQSRGRPMSRHEPLNLHGLCTCAKNFKIYND